MKTIEGKRLQCENDYYYAMIIFDVSLDAIAKSKMSPDHPPP